MKFEIQMFILLITVGLLIKKKIDWRGQFFLFLVLCLWIFYNWKKS